METLRLNDIALRETLRQNDIALRETIATFERENALMKQQIQKLSETRHGNGSLNVAFSVALTSGYFGPVEEDTNGEGWHPETNIFQPLVAGKFKKCIQQVSSRQIENTFEVVFQCVFIGPD